MIRLPGLDNRAIELTALSKYDKSGAGISVFLNRCWHANYKTSDSINWSVVLILDLTTFETKSSTSFSLCETAPDARRFIFSDHIKTNHLITCLA